MTSVRLGSCGHKFLISMLICWLYVVTGTFTCQFTFTGVNGVLITSAAGAFLPSAAADWQPLACYCCYGILTKIEISYT